VDDRSDHFAGRVSIGVNVARILQDNLVPCSCDVFLNWNGLRAFPRAAL
jgi:hypothetical protein